MADVVGSSYGIIKNPLIIHNINIGIGKMKINNYNTLKNENFQ